MPDEGYNLAISFPRLSGVTVCRVIVVMLLSLSVSVVASEDWTTFYERSGHLRTPSYEETIEYCKRLSDASPQVHYTVYGTSARGRDLPLLIVDRNGNFQPELVRATGNVVFLIQAGIHSGEIDGKDAGLMLVRDMTVEGSLASLLDHVTILFMPIFSVDAHERSGPHNRINQNGPEEMGWRATATNLNLNRDYLKADTPEMQAWLELYTEWLPEFFADCHVTDGADYQYAVTYALELYDNMDAGLVEWTRDRYLASLEMRMADSGFPIQRYCAFRTRHEPETGLKSWAGAPRYSEGYTALQNRPGLLIETHMLKDYRTRVTGTYETLKHTLEILGEDHAALKRECAAADDRTGSAALRAQPFPLDFEVDLEDSVMIDFLGFESEKTKSDLTGGTWHSWSNRPATLRVPYFPHQTISVAADLPEAYILPPEWWDVIARLGLHGVALTRLEAPVTLEVSSYRFQGAAWRQAPYEGRHPLTFTTETIVETRRFPTGSVLVDMNQRAARVAAHILEPDSPDSFVRWGFFDPIFEQKEYAETYVMETVAREMLAADAALAEEFETWRRDHSDATPTEILHWFYQRSLWWDDRINLYPVGKLFDRSEVDRLKR